MDIEVINELLEILEPFADMYREGDEFRKREIACERGYASSKTILTSYNFYQMQTIYKQLKVLKKLIG